MKINQFQDETLADEYLDIYYRDYTDKIESIIESVTRIVDEKIRVKMAESYGYIAISKVYYVESVDRKYVANLKDESLQLQTDVTLKELADRYLEMGFVRVSKSTLLNINKVDKVMMDLNMRMLAHLKNGEVIQINRSYKKQFNQVLTAYTERKESK